MQGVEAQRGRLLGLDLFRGLVITLMLFVNQLDEMPNVPAWLKHAPAHSDAITVPDLVFPWFLFMVGVAIPLALLRRAAAGEDRKTQALHVVVRAASLVLIGVVFEFHGALDPRRTGLSETAWMSLFYVGMFALWHERRAETAWSRGLRVAGALLIAVLLALYRDGAGRWLATEWWGILGMIGWGYLSVSLVVLASRGSRLVLGLGLVAMLGLYVGSRHGALSFVPRSFLAAFDVGELLGSVSAVVTVGALVGVTLQRPSDPGRRLRALLGLAALLGFAGLVLRPLHGLSKIGTTESYALVTAALASLVFALLHHVCDGRDRLHGRLVTVREAGKNALVAYVFPNLWSHALACLGLDGLFFLYAYPFARSAGLLSCANAAVITGFYLVVIAGLSRLGLRLKL